jgi:hypothetical protein
MKELIKIFKTLLYDVVVKSTNCVDLVHAVEGGRGRGRGAESQTETE